MRTVSIFIPAYNAAGHIQDVINRISQKTWSCVNNVYIVNDGSCDSTEEILNAIGKNNHQIIPIHFTENRGYGSAVKEGLRRCAHDGCDYAACIHADGQYPPEMISEMVQSMEAQSLDLMQGSRIASGTALSGGMPIYKYVAGRALVLLENIVFRLQLTDYHSGFLIYSRNVLNAISFDALSSSFDFDLEVIASARAREMAIGEYPIKTRYADEISYLNPITYGFRVLRVLLRYYRGVYSK